jgi:predicted ATP-grasp superfamily ATP-dependent carboligase
MENQTNQPSVMYIRMMNEDGSVAMTPVFFGGKLQQPDENGIIKIEQDEGEEKDCQAYLTSRDEMNKKMKELFEEFLKVAHDQDEEVEEEDLMLF